MNIRIGARITLDRNEAPESFLVALRRALTVENPEYVDREKRGYWTGDISPTLSLVLRNAQTIEVPRGAIALVRELAREHGIPLEPVYTLPRHEQVLPEFPVENLCLRHYQWTALDNLISASQGLAVIPCGGGKTRIGVAAIARLRLPAIVVVHTWDLAEQWRAQISTLLDITPGIIGGGEHSIAPVTIALVQSLATLAQQDLEELLDRFGVLILDEAHHAPATTFFRVVNYSTARYRFGLTATPDRADGLTPLLGQLFGSTVARVSHDELVEAGVLSLPSVFSVETRFAYPYACDADWAPMMRALIRDRNRNAILLDTISAQACQGHLCLVLSGQIAHCNALCLALLERGVSVELLTSDIPKKKRTKALEDARAGKVRILVATSVADEGLDLPTLSRLFLCYPTRAEGRTIQRVGRLMRVAPGKPAPVLFDFVDSEAGVLLNQFYARRRTYQRVLGVRTQSYQPTDTAPVEAIA